MAKNEKITEVENQDYGYYSRLLKREFDSLAELRAEEAKVKQAEEEKQLALVAKKEKAAEVEAAYKEIIETRKQAKAIIDEANARATELIKSSEAKYEALKQAFIDEYGAFHMSYYNNNGKEEISVSDLINSLLRDIWF